MLGRNRADRCVATGVGRGGLGEGGKTATREEKKKKKGGPKGLLVKKSGSLGLHVPSWTAAAGLLEEGRVNPGGERGRGGGGGASPGSAGNESPSGRDRGKILEKGIGSSNALRGRMV